MIYHIEADEFVKKLVTAAFPDYAGRKFKLHVSDAPISCGSYFDSGSYNLLKFINLATMEVFVDLPAQKIHVAGIHAVLLSPGFACVEHSMFMGKDGGITIHIPPESDWRPPAKVVTLHEKIVLLATRKLKPTYNGVRDFRYYEAHIQTGINWEEWNEARESLVDRGLLNARGSITPKGCEAISSEDSFSHLQVRSS